MPRYNHAYDIGFSLTSNHERGDDVTPEMFREALVQRMKDLDAHDEWGEAIGCPFDTYCEDDDVPDDTPSLDTSFHDHEMDIN